MVTVCELPCTREAEAEWDAYVDSKPDAAVYHASCLRGFIEAATGNRTRYLQARRDGRICGVLPLAELRSRLFGHYFVALPYFNHCGILADDDETRRVLADAAARQVFDAGAAYLELRHLGPLSGLEWPVKSTKDEMTLGLPDSPDALMATFPSKLRSQIRRPQKEGMTARIGGTELLDAFYATFARNMRDLGTPVYGRRFFSELFSRLGERLSIVACEYQGRPVAAGVLLAWRETVEIPWASSLRSVNHLSPNMLMYWAALRHATEKGYRWFDFGRSSRGTGTWKFKEQWGARPVPLHWYYFMRQGGALPELNPANAKYRLAINVWRKLPLAITNRIGPYLVTKLP